MRPHPPRIWRHLQRVSAGPPHKGFNFNQASEESEPGCVFPGSELASQKLALRVYKFLSRCVHDGKS